MGNQYPLNQQILYGYWDGVNVSSFWAKEKWVSWIGIRGVCERENCQETEEHYIYDGQIFYQPPNKSNQRKE